MFQAFVKQMEQTWAVAFVKRMEQGWAVGFKGVLKIISVDIGGEVTAWMFEKTSLSSILKQLTFTIKMWWIEEPRCPIWVKRS